jgi:Family of unknown function (DUF5362)
MENNEILDQGLNASLNQDSGLSSEDKGYLETAAKWAKFMAVMGFIGVGFMVLGAFALMAMGSMMGSALEGGSPMMGGMMGTGIAVLYLLMALPFFFTCLYLYRFASKIQASLYSNNLTATDAFLNLRNYFRLRGYIVVVIIVLYLAAIVFGVGAAAMMK